MAGVTTEPLNSLELWVNMALKLNKIDSNIIREDLNKDRARLESFLAADGSSPLKRDPIRYSRRCADAALEFGLGLYQQEGDRAEIRRSFGIAGAQLISILSMSEPNAALSPLEFEKALALAVCFSPRSIDENVSAVPVSKFFADPKALSLYEVLAHYLDIARRFVTSGQLDRPDWGRVEAECTRSNAGRYDAVVNLAKLRALEAVDSRNAALLNDSIGTLVEDHENEALRGENQRSTRGFVCLPALMFAQLGAERDLACTVASVYLPLALLGE